MRQKYKKKLNLKQNVPVSSTFLNVRLYKHNVYVGVQVDLLNTPPQKKKRKKEAMLYSLHKILTLDPLVYGKLLSWEMCGSQRAV